MARKSRVQMDGESAFRCLNEIRAIAIEDDTMGAYHRNAADCGRWVRAVMAAKMALPQWMHDGNIRFFAVMWRFNVSGEGV